MYNLWTRLNAVFFYGATALFLAASASNITTRWFTPQAVVTRLALTDVKALKPMREPMLLRAQTNDRAVFTFDLEADLRGVFNWNVKQLFVFVTADYQTKSNKLNEVVIWDRVVASRADAVLSVHNGFVKYPLMDNGKELRGTPISLTLHWDAMPLTGRMFVTSRGNHTVRLPAAYCSELEGAGGKCVLEPPLASVVDRVASSAAAG